LIAIFVDVARTAAKEKVTRVVTYLSMESATYGSKLNSQKQRMIQYCSCGDGLDLRALIFDLIAIFVDVARTAAKEKVTRVVMATLRVSHSRPLQLATR
jgi:hypothetical protein